MNTCLIEARSKIIEVMGIKIIQVGLKIWVLLLTTILIGDLKAQVTHDWENPQIIGKNKEQTVATFSSYTNGDDAQRFSNPASEKSLNGKWKFHWAPNPESRPVNFHQSDFNVSDWNEIVVPGNWQMQGFGTPIYTNINYPFKMEQPKVMLTPPDNFTSFKFRNPVGSYRRNFDVPAEWMEKTLFVKFDGVKSAFYLWINGEKVGYSQGSKTAAE